MSWTLAEVERRFLQFLRESGHADVSGRFVLSPDDDVLYSAAGLHPMTPYLQGQPHPQGTRVGGIHRCVRARALEHVGDDRHLTTVGLLGRWTLDGGASEAVPGTLRLLTDIYGLDASVLRVTVFGGSADDGLPADEAAMVSWTTGFAEAGVAIDGRVRPSAANWWANGPLGPCGPESELSVTNGGAADPVPVGTTVSVTGDRDAQGTVHRRERPMTGTDLSAEHTVQALDGGTVWDAPELTELLDGVAWALDLEPSAFAPEHVRSQRIIADHLRSALALAATGIYPSSRDAGHLLRRLTCRAVRHAELLLDSDDGLVDKCGEVVAEIATIQGRRWPELTGESGEHARAVLGREAAAYAGALRLGLDPTLV